MLELIGMPLSPFVKKCELVLREKGLDFEYRQISPLIDQAAYKQHNPLGKMPILLDGDFALPDSSAIASYLDGQYSDPPLLPANPKDKAWVLWLEEFSDHALLELCAGIFRCRVIGPRLMGLPVNEEGVERLLGKSMSTAFDYLEQQLSDGRDYLWHGGYTLADIAVSTQLCMFVLAGESVDGQRWPKLSDWFARVQQRSAFQTCLAEEQRFFKIWTGTEMFKPADGFAAAQQLNMDTGES
ncbi:MAG: glutathione S-transferase family protein [Erythrobacter sp.]